MTDPMRMTYGLFQYYTDELMAWNKTAEFHREESREIVSKIGAMRDQSGSEKSQKGGNEFIDQLTVQQQVLNNIAQMITTQQQRLGKTPSQKAIEVSVCQQQDTLRGKMYNAERNFIRTKYNCYIFLSSFVSD